MNAPTPLPQGFPPPGIRTVLVYGGVFDPPHLAHTRLPRAVVESLDDAAILYVPAGVSPHKAGGALVSDEHRLAMLRLAIADVPRSAIWTDELSRPAPSYTAETIDRLAPLLATGVGARLLIGADQAAAFHRWRGFRDLFEAAPPLVMLRAPIESADILVDRLLDSGAWSVEEVERWRRAIADVPPLEISSTRVRELLRRGDAEALGSLLDRRVLELIAEHRLYRDG